MPSSLMLGIAALENKLIFPGVPALGIDGRIPNAHEMTTLSNSNLMDTAPQAVPLKISRYRLLRWLSQIRYNDSAVVLAPTVVGLACGIEPPLSVLKLWGMLTLFAGAYLLMAHCFAFNDWTDAVADSRDPSKYGKAFLNLGVTRWEMFTVTTILACAGLLLIATAGYQTLVCAVLIMVCNLGYSLPHQSFEGKQLPGVSTLLHVIPGMLVFLLGYCFWSAIDLRGLMIGPYFALVFIAGHLIQEFQDYAGDRASGVRTYAVRFGQRPVYWAALITSTISFVYLTGLALAGFLPVYLAAVALLYIPLVVVFSKTNGADCDYFAARRLRRGFRDLHAVIVGLIVLVCVVDRWMLN